MLATLLPLTAGEATVAGADLRRQPQQVRQRIGYVPQGGSTDPAETGRGRARPAGAAVRDGQDGRARPAPARSSRRSISKPRRTGRSAPTRVACAGGSTSGSGIVHRPAVLFLDEPTTGLDPQARARMWDEITRLRDGGTTVFLTTHYLEEADALADRLAIIDHGLIVAEGTADELKRQVAGDVVTLGIDGDQELVLATVRRQAFVREASSEDELIRLYVDQGDTAVPHLLRLLDAAGLRARTITLARPSLDDVFLRQTGPLAARRAGRLTRFIPATPSNPSVRHDRRPP